MTPGGEVHCSMAFNPSHLEIVSAVAEGSVRARQDRRKDPEGKTVLPIIIHGDASFAGPGRRDGNLPDVADPRLRHGRQRAHHHQQPGRLHHAAARTTARSTEYCTDIAKMVQAPIFHVNGDDPEAVMFVTQLALDFRNDLPQGRRGGHHLLSPPRP